MNVSMTIVSSFPGVSRVALVNPSTYSFTVSPSFCLHPIIVCVSPLYHRSYMNFVRKAYFNCAKLLILPIASVLNHVVTFPSRVVGK